MNRIVECGLAVAGLVLLASFIVLIACLSVALIAATARYVTS